MRFQLDSASEILAFAPSSETFAPVMPATVSIYSLTYRSHSPLVSPECFQSLFDQVVFRVKAIQNITVFFLCVVRHNAILTPVTFITAFFFVIPMCKSHSMAYKLSVLHIVFQMLPIGTTLQVTYLR